MIKLIAPPLTIYAHMPWCVRKCPYCDFNSHVAPESIPQERYVDCLLDDLEYDLPEVEGREVQSIFFGGGTPSLFAPELIKRFLDGVHGRVPIAKNAEITLEANPGTIEHGRFAGYREAGVTRVSLGAQSFDDRQLKLLGRIHGRQQIIDSVAELKAAGFENFNLDLMYGLPQQSVNQALADIDCAIELAPTHLSHYQLALEPGTVFYHQPPQLPDEDAIWEMQLACQARLAALGYAQYEVSAYALSGFMCCHNLNYWHFGDYLGLGAGAHGKWTDAITQTIHRSVRVKQPRTYLAGQTAAARLESSQTISPSELPFEFMLNALRLCEGFSAEQFESRTGHTLASLGSTLSRACRLGLVEECDQSCWRATPFGRRFLNDLQSMFLVEIPSSTTALSAPSTAV